MANMMSSPEVAQGISSVAGTALTAAGEMQQGDATQARGAAALRIGQRKQQALEFEASQLDVNAGQSIASAQRAAMEEGRTAQLMASRALAIAAANGGGTSGDVMQQVANIAAQGQYKATVALYTGEDRARTMRLQAAAKRYQGATGMEDASDANSAYQDAGRSQKNAAFGTVLSGAAKFGSLFSKYNSNKDAETSTYDGGGGGDGGGGSGGGGLSDFG